MTVIVALYTSDLELRRWREIKNLARKMTACRNTCFEEEKDCSNHVEDKEEESYEIREF